MRLPAKAKKHSKYDVTATKCADVIGQCLRRVHTYFEPVDRAAVNERGEHSESIAESVADRTEG